MVLFFMSASVSAQEYVEYYPSGVKKLEGDTFNGSFVYYYESGVVFLEGHTQNGIKDSVWNYYNEERQQILQETYKEGQLYTKQTWKRYPGGTIGEDIRITYLIVPGQPDSSRIIRDSKFWYENGMPAADIHQVNGADSGSSYWNRKGLKTNREGWLIEMRMEAENK